MKNYCFIFIILLILLGIYGCQNKTSPPIAYDNLNQPAPSVTPSAAISSSDLYEQNPIKPGSPNMTADDSEAAYNNIHIKRATEEDLANFDSYFSYINDMNGDRLLIYPDVKIYNFIFFPIVLDESSETASFFAGETLFSVDELTPEKPFVLKLQIPGSAQSYGISFIDENGVVRYFTIYLSGRGEEEGPPYILLESNKLNDVYTSSKDSILTGPFVGYVNRVNTSTFYVYTKKNGNYIVSLPMSLFNDFPANHFEPGWMNIDVYCGTTNGFTWAVVCTGPSAGTGNANICTSNDGGETWWVGDKYSMYTGTVTGAGFVSPDVGFISYRYYSDQGPEISRTTDGGKTWNRMLVDIPSYLKKYKMTPLSPVFTGLSGSYPIELHDSDGNVLISYLTTEDGGLTWKWKGDALDTAVSLAFLDDNKASYRSGECSAEGHIILGYEEQSDYIKVYALTIFGEYGFENGNFVKVSGSGIIPVVFKFTGSIDKLSFSDIVHPLDGSYYTQTIKEMFPSEYIDRALNPTDSDIQELKTQECMYAASYLKKIGRAAIIGDYRDFKHVLLSDVGVSVNISNSIAGNALFINYPMWLGTCEALENGVRYVYEKSYVDNIHEIIFTKYEYNTNTIAELIRLDSITGEILQTYSQE